MNQLRGEQLVRLLGEDDARQLLGELDALVALHKAAIPALKELRQYLDDSGGCDHSVGICWCDVIKIAEDLDEAIKAAEIPPTVDRG